MKINLFTKLLVFSLVNGLVFAEKTNFTGECKEIYEYLKEKSYQKDLSHCTVNTDGKVEELFIYTFCLTESDVNKIISYPSLKSLGFDTITTSHTTPYESLRGCEQLKVFPDGISKLTKLDNLNFYGFTNFKEKDLLKIPKSVKKLTLGKFSITQTFINDLSTLNNIEKLFFRLTTFDEKLNYEPLKKMKNINYLVLSNSETTQTVKKYLPTFILKYFPNVKKLELKEYSFDQKIMDYIGTLTYLKELTLDSCGYDTGMKLNPIGKLKNLEYLSIKGSTEYCSFNVDTTGDNKCPLTEIPEVIFNLSNLKKLIITSQNSDVNFDSLKNIGKLKNLEYLDLSECAITMLPDSIGNLKKLTYLDLNQTQIKAIPESIGNLTNLQKLFMYETSITKLPDSIGKLKKLVNLEASYCDIKIIPDTIGDMESLVELNLYSNKIIEIPDTIGNLGNLKNLILGYNKVERFPKTLGKLKNLTTLHIQHNLIDDDLPQSLNGLTKLSSIELYGNINLKGKTLTNSSLKNCYYGLSSNNVPYSLCKAKEMNCFKLEETYHPCSDSSESTETSEIVETSEPVKTSEVIETSEPAKTSEAVETSESAKTSEAVETSESAKSSEAVETSESAKTSEAVETSEPAKTSEVVETSESAKTSEAVETSEPAKTSEVVETSESAKTSEAVVTSEPEKEKTSENGDDNVESYITLTVEITTEITSTFTSYYPDTEEVYTSPKTITITSTIYSPIATTTTSTTTTTTTTNEKDEEQEDDTEEDEIENIDDDVDDDDDDEPVEVDDDEKDEREDNDSEEDEDENESEEEDTENERENKHKNHKNKESHKDKHKHRHRHRHSHVHSHGHKYIHIHRHKDSDDESDDDSE